MQNLLIAVIYSAVFVVLFIFAYKTLDTGSQQSLQVWLTAGILSVILGKYLLERFFTSPLNVLANCISILIALIFDPNKNFLWCVLIIIISIILLWSTIVVCTSKKEYKYKDTLYKGLVYVGKAKLIFSLVFLVYTYQYLAQQKLFDIFIISIVLWLDMVYVSFIEKVVCCFRRQVQKSDSIYGVIDGKISNKLYKLTITCGKKQLDFSDICVVKNSIGKYVVSKIVSINQDINEYKYIIQLTDLVLEHDKIGFNVFHNSIISIENSVSKIDMTTIDENVKKDILSMLNKKEYKDCIGYVAENSEINTINFVLFNYKHNYIFEGMIATSDINGINTLFQIVSAVTKKDENGALRVVAQKLGSYDKDNRLINHVKWLPEMYSPVYVAEQITGNQIADSTIGVLPNSNYQIQLSNINQLVTYNTAILGILGIGKSCLAFELIKKVVDKNIKVICIDISEQYATYNGLLSYVEKAKFNLDSEELIGRLNSNSSRRGSSDTKIYEWGNAFDYKSLMKADIKRFIEDENKMVSITNPNKYIITKPQQLNFGKPDGEFIELSIVEKTRMLTESIFECAREIGLSNSAKYLIVFEEAHSLIPEFNSVAAKGDESHSNAIAKIILQGRKYGLGSLLITQRTANVSKSALCQCNTIFAMRSYDDTSKAFLDNFIGSTYSTLLPSLEERTAIVTGKGVDCKMPIIITLNDKSLFEKYTENNREETVL